MKNKDIYPRSIIEGVNAIVHSCLNDSDDSTFSATAPNYLTSLFETTDKDVFPSDGYRCIWYNLIKFEQYGKIDWIKAYWEFAVSYAQFSLQDFTVSNADNDFLFKFKEFHHMYCAYLLSRGRYELVEHLLSYSNTIPYSNTLVVRNWREALVHLIEFEKPLYFDGNYSFYLNNGVKDEGIGRCWLIILYLTCLVKQNEDAEFYLYDNIYLLRSYKLLLANIHSLIENSKYWKSIIENNDYKRVFNLSPSDSHKISSTIQSFYERINKKIDEIERKQPIDNNSVNEFKVKVRTLIGKYLSLNHVPILVNAENIKSLYSFVPITENRVPKDMFLSEPSMAYVNFEESYTHMVCSNIAAIYRSQFILNSPVKTYLIDYDELTEALDKLDFVNGFCVLCMGVSRDKIKNKHIGNSDIYSLPSQESCVIVMKNDDLPQMMLKSDLVDIDIAEIKDEKDCIIKGCVSYFYPDTTVRYVKLNLAHLTYVGRSSSINKIEPIMNYIV